MRLLPRDAQVLFLMSAVGMPRVGLQRACSTEQTNLHVYGDITLGQMGRPEGFDREVTNNTARSGKS